MIPTHRATAARPRDAGATATITDEPVDAHTTEGQPRKRQAVRMAPGSAPRAKETAEGDQAAETADGAGADRSAPRVRRGKSREG